MQRGGVWGLYCIFPLQRLKLATGRGKIEDTVGRDGV